MKTCMFTLGAMALATSLILAQEGPGGPDKGKGPGKGKRPNPEQIFKKLDTDANNSISLDEFKASPMAQRDEAKAEEIYKKIDADSDGAVTLEEFKSHRPPHRKGGPDGPGKGKGKGKAGPPAQ